MVISLATSNVVFRSLVQIIFTEWDAFLISPISQVKVSNFNVWRILSSGTNVSICYIYNLTSEWNNSPFLKLWDLIFLLYLFRARYFRTKFS